MAAIPGVQFGRRVSLLVVEGEKALELGKLHFRFETKQEDEESPNNAAIRVFNLSKETQEKVQKEYSRVVLQGGYDESNFGVIFDGTIKQFRVGKEGNSTETYLDILAADGDQAYNYSIVNRSVAAGVTAGERIAQVVGAMSPNGVTPGKILIPSTGGVLPRGKVLFGMARAILRSEVQTQGATWSIQNGKVNVIPLDGYLPTEAVVLNSATGLIGRPEATQEGVRVRCLLNPKIAVGGLVRIDNASINKTVPAPQEAIPGAQLAYNSRVGIQQFANTDADGLYRVYVAEFVGDTRGQDFYTDLTCLTVDPVTLKVKPYG